MLSENHFQNIRKSTQPVSALFNDFLSHYRYSISTVDETVGRSAGGSVGESAG